jgi:hypothetical protein
MHPCTEDDISKFYEPAKSSVKAFDNYKSSLMCMNDEDYKGVPIDKKIYGHTGGAYRAIELNIIPCRPKQETPYNRHLKDKECIADLTSKASLKRKLQEIKDYLGRPSLNVVVNNERLDLRYFKTTAREEWLAK